MKKIIYIIAIPMVIGSVVFFLTKDLPSSYESETTIFTGVTSNTGLSVENIRVDNNAAQNEYNNILTLLSSSSLMEEVALRLLTQHLMLDKAQKEIIGENAFSKLKASVPEDVKKLIVKGNAEKSYQNLVNYIKEDDSNYIYKLLNHNHPHYSVAALSTLKSSRLTTSDLIKIKYSCNDPGICFNTVKITAEVFIKRYGLIKNSQSSSAVGYFETKLQEAAVKLEESEDKLLKFNIENDIINYEEQTKQITTQLEKIELNLQDIKMSYLASQAVLSKIEKEVQSRLKLNLRSKDVLNVRQELVDVNNEIANKEIDRANSSSQELIRLYQRRNNLGAKLESKIDSLNVYETNSQGMETAKLLDQWIVSVKEYEQFNAMYKSMQARRLEFMNEYKKYAPLGAMLQRYQREIEVNENEYLNTLQHLGLARQKMKNSDMVTNMKIMDDPKFPITSLPSKKKLYVIIAALFSLIFYLLVVFLVELMDHSIKTPQKLAQLSKLEVPAAFCLHNNKKFLNTELVSEKAAVYLIEKLMQITDATTQPKIIQLVSFWNDEEKKYVTEIIHKKLLESGKSCEILSFSADAEFSDDIQKFRIENEKFNQYLSYQELITDQKIKSDYIISIISPVSEGVGNIKIMQTADISYVVFNAGSTWNEADNFNLEKIKSIIPQHLYAVLTYARPDDLEAMYGDLPKKRSKFRKMVKKNINKYT